MAILRRKKGAFVTKKHNKYHYLNKITCESEVYLQIMAPTQPFRLKTRLIGVDPNMSVIVAMGNGPEWIAAKDYIREGQKVIVRLMSTDQPDANLVAFHSKVQKVMSIAGRWLLLDYPKEVQQVPLRQDKRLPIKVEASLLDTETKKIRSTGFLSDLSTHGCAFIGEPINKSLESAKYLLQASVEDELKTIIISVKNIKKVDLTSSAIQYGGILEGGSDEVKKFVEPLLLNSLFK